MNEYHVGDTAKLSASVTDDTGALQDPTTITCSVKPPSGDVATYTWPLGNGEIVRDAQGKFHLLVSITAAGTWRYRWTSTGGTVPVPASREGFLAVLAPSF